MAQCADSTWTINMIGDKNPTSLLETLFFDLKVDPAGVISGDVFILVNPLQRISSVTGTCRPNTQPDGVTLSLSFTWDKVDVFMVGFSHRFGPVIHFDGRFLATTHTFLEGESSVLSAAMAAFAPSDGDTGIGTGQQT